MPTERRFWLRVKSALASLYFAAMFFGVFPAAILFATRDEPFATGGAIAVTAGVAVIAAASWFVARLVAVFIREGDGTHVPIDPPRNLVRSLAYERTRNPMYLAYVVTVIGEALLFASGALLLYSAALWLLAHVYVVTREEPLLERRFGDEYRRYRARVPRWGFATSAVGEQPGGGAPASQPPRR